MIAPIIEKEIELYYDSKGKSPIINWMSKPDNLTKKRIQTRILRLSSGNYGDFKKVNKNILELRLDFGSGYRVYFGEDGKNIVILLSGGDKKTQKNDILEAIGLWHQYKGAK
jgi:putative addiction module killer protein